MRLMGDAAKSAGHMHAQRLAAHQTKLQRSCSNGPMHTWVCAGGGMRMMTMQGCLVSGAGGCPLCHANAWQIVARRAPSSSIVSVCVLVP